MSHIWIQGTQSAAFMQLCHWLLSNFIRSTSTSKCKKSVMSGASQLLNQRKSCVCLWKSASNNKTANVLPHFLTCLISSFCPFAVQMFAILQLRSMFCSCVLNSNKVKSQMSSEAAVISVLTPSCSPAPAYKRHKLDLKYLFGEDQQLQMVYWIFSYL